MSSRKHMPIGEASRIVAANILALRKSHGWPVRLLSQKLAAAGRPLLASAITKIELGSRRVDVDDLVAFAKAFGVEPASMLTAPDCDTCNGAPPTGFTCQTCGRSTT